jgi:AcrR family transcriptional regulator
MDQNIEEVKSRRRYDSSRRREQAYRSRHLVLDAADSLFRDRGFGATTIALIARTANVSVETIYKAFGGKPGIVRALWQRSLAGAGPVHAEVRSDEMQRRASDPRAVIRQAGMFMMEVAPLAAPILLLIRAAAATDSEMAALLREVDQGRLERMESNARRLAELGGLRDGLTIEEIRDVLWTYSSAELYELLVLRRCWSLERYAEFAANAMTAALVANS